MAHEDEHFIDTKKMVWPYSLFDEPAVKLFAKGKLYNAHEYFGSRALTVIGTAGFYFAVWAPNATEISVVGDFNGWKKGLHPLYVRQDSSGIWEGFLPRFQPGATYKYCITGAFGKETYKADPFANYAELRPGTASVAHEMFYEWQDSEWMIDRKQRNALSAPWSVYEVHLGSWMRPERDRPDVYNSYREIGERLVPYVKAMGFTHVELMPVMEHPYDGSWGYQGTGFFAATSRFGYPQDLMQLIDLLHQNNIGVVLDWVPSHFPGDEHGLYLFDGAHTYEYGDMRKGYHKDWSSYIFNYKRGEVRSFLAASAHFWLKHFHADGLRVDAVNSIIRLDFSRGPGEWEPNELGTHENLEAISFLKDLNKMIYREFPDVQTIAEEASDWPGITKPVSKGGFGFGMKWMMGWMHDSFRYFKKGWPPRKFHQDDFTFSMMYFYDEKFMMPLSHDEVVHGKSPMIYKMPGNEQEQFANLRLLYACMFTHPGAKLLFMGSEFAQTSEWNYNTELDWPLLQFPLHEGMQECVRALNHLYRNEPAMHELQFDKKGFEWVDISHPESGILVFRRSGKNRGDDLTVCLNMSDQPQADWPATVRGKASWLEVFNSSHKRFGSPREMLNGRVEGQLTDKRRKLYKIKVNLPAFSAVVLK